MTSPASCSQAPCFLSSHPFLWVLPVLMDECPWHLPHFLKSRMSALWTRGLLTRRTRKYLECLTRTKIFSGAHGTVAINNVVIPSAPFLFKSPVTVVPVSLPFHSLSVSEVQCQRCSTMNQFSSEVFLPLSHFPVTQSLCKKTLQDIHVIGLL